MYKYHLFSASPRDEISRPKHRHHSTAELPKAALQPPREPKTGISLDRARKIAEGEISATTTMAPTISSNDSGASAKPRKSQTARKSSSSSSSRRVEKSRSFKNVRRSNSRRELAATTSKEKRSKKWVNTTRNDIFPASKGSVLNATDSVLISTDQLMMTSGSDKSNSRTGRHKVKSRDKVEEKLRSLRDTNMKIRNHF